MRDRQYTQTFRFGKGSVKQRAEMPDGFSRQRAAKRRIGSYSTSAVGERVNSGLYLGGRQKIQARRAELTDSIKAAKLLWTEETLDRWLTDPEKLVPETDMTFRVAPADERRAIIDYLPQNTAK